MAHIAVGPRLGAFCLAAFVFAQPMQAQTRLTASELEKVGKLSLEAGAFEQAIAIADALIERDSTDATAHLIRSRALRNSGRYTDAQTAARNGWKHGTSDGEKYSAAMLMAQALSSDGKRTRSQLWLRRAAQLAPTKRHAERAAQDFRYVRQRNPWQTNLSFTAAPNSNINNGSSRETSMIFNPFDINRVSELPLSAASKALSGIETGLDVQSRYRVHQTEHSAHDLRFGMSYRTYKLSRSAQDALNEADAERTALGLPALDLSGGDFAYGTVQAGYGYKRLRGDRRGEFSFSADLGQSFYGGARYNSYLRASIGQTYHMSAATKLNFGLSADMRTAQAGSDHDTLRLTTGTSRKLSNGDGLYFGVSAAAVRSDAQTAEYDEIGLRSGYILGRDVLGTSFQFGLSTSFRDYDVSLHDASGRREFTVGGEVTATFKQIDYYGFNPSISLTASKTNSNIGLYDVNRVGLSIGIASAF